nr:zinc-binding dehydrogenase [Nakamurella flavida]
MAEPLSVALHAVARAGEVTGRSVLVTGAGPIGCLVVAALVVAGARSVIVSDMQDAALAVATAVGATGTVRADRPDDPGWPAEVDIAVEASGTAPGLDTCVRRVSRGGVVVQLGLLPPGDVPFTGNLLVTREIDLRGAFRFDHEFDRALDLLAGDLPVGPVVTQIVPLADARAAFELAGDRSRASKVLLDLR